MQPPVSPHLVRPYRSSDRFAVRRICGDTADRGAPVENFFPDRELVADLITAYYTDYEPERTWIAECDGQTVGYLTGGLDLSRWWRVTLRQIAPSAMARSVGRGVLWKAQTWRFLWTALRMWRRHPSVSLEKYPAHVHVNVRAEFRGHQVGWQLMTLFLEQVKSSGLSGVHANVRADNAGGRRFFERMGFLPLHEDGNAETIIYGKPL